MFLLFVLALILIVILLVLVLGIENPLRVRAERVVIKRR